MHLTNVAIQKKNEKYDENTGMKWPISKLKQYLLSKHGLAATSKLFGDIQVPFMYHMLRHIADNSACLELNICAATDPALLRTKQHLVYIRIHQPHRKQVL